MTKEMINNMIFDLQLFADAEIYLATSAVETISITKDGTSIKATAQKEGKASTVLKPKTKDAPLSGVNAGAGSDSINVGANVSAITVAGGRGNDTIKIDASAGGNYYVYNSGDGKDTIVGWNVDSDVLVMDSFNISDTAMSADGNELLIKNGSGWVAFQGLEYGQKVKVAIAGSTATPQEVEVKKIMQATTRSESVNNTGESGATAHKGTNATDYWAIDASAGNDSVTNNFDFVSINGGNGNDKIYIGTNADNATSGTVTKNITEGVTIRGGAGNDTIDVTADTVAGTDSDAGQTFYGAHVYEFGEDDGYDSILGFNSNDTIHFVGLTASQISAIEAETDVKGNYIIKAGNTRITLVKQGDKDLGGTHLNIFTKAEGGTPTALADTVYENFATKVITAQEDTTTDPPTPEESHYEIPKYILLDNGANTKTYDETFNNYTIDAAGGSDLLTVSGKDISIDAGTGNDQITLTGGTNVNSDATDADSALSVNEAVTIQAGYGNDYIDARADKTTINDTDSTEVRAAHVYQIATDHGRDSIMGFNEKDTIQIVTEGVTGSDISTKFDTTGKFFIVKVGSAEVYLDVTTDYFKGGKELNIVNKAGAKIDSIKSGDYPLVQVSLDGSGNPTTVPADTTDDSLATKKAVSFKYYLPSVLMGTAGSDRGEAKRLVNHDDNFNITALNGDDEIANIGASNVSIDGGIGNDTIWLTGKTVGEGATAETVYGEGVTVHGGYGNDVIFNEFVSAGTGLATKDYEGNEVTVAADEEIKTGHVYNFGYNDGHDTIHFFSEYDTIAIDANSTYIGSSVAGSDLIIKVGYGEDTTRVTSSITLKDYVKTEDDYDKGFYLKKGNATVVNTDIVKEIRGTTGSELIPKNEKDGYLINALGGNDTIENSGANVTIDGGAGGDSIVNSGDDVYIDAGYGHDRIILQDAANNTVVAGYGNDSIYNSGQVGTAYYIFGEDEGTNYILNYQGDSTIRTTNIAAGDVTSLVSSEGYVLELDHSTTIIIKGELIPSEDGYHVEPTRPLTEEDIENANSAEEWETYRTDYANYQKYVRDPKNYANLESGVKINIETYDSTNSTYISTPYVVPKEIVGTDTHDSLNSGMGAIVIKDNTMDGYTVDAKAGNDSIKSSSAEVSINAGVGYDIIELGESAKKNTVLGGKGNDKIYSNGAANVFQYVVGDGNDTIYGYSSLDSISISGGEPTSASMTANGYQITFGDGGYILLKEIAENTDQVHIIGSSTAHRNIEKVAFGTNIADSVTIGTALVGLENETPVTINSDFRGFEYRAFNGNDSILVESGADSITVSAGDGHDHIEIENETNAVTVKLGFGHDTVEIAHGTTDAHIFEIDATNQGINYIKGINSEDVIFVNIPGASILEADFKDNYFRIVLSDNQTVINLLGDNGSDDYEKLGKGNAAKSFKLRLVNADNTITETVYDVPTIIKIEDTLMHTITEKAVVLGDDQNNDVVIATDYVSVNTGAGKDIIEVQSGEQLSITGGKGNDSLSLIGEKHIINYNYGDGNDTIKGWETGNFLNISGYTDPDTQLTTLMTGAGGDVFAISLSNREVITFEDVKAGDNKQIVLIGKIAENSSKTVSLPDGTIVKAVTIDVPNYIQGTDYADNLTNTDGEDFVINARAGADVITNKGNRASIDGGMGNDIITSEYGNDITVLGGADNDQIFVSDSHKTNGRGSIIDGGTGKDFISLGAGVQDATVSGGAGDDTIYGNTQNNVFVYNSGDGNDVIYGFHNSDILKILGVAVSTVSAESADGNSTIAVADTEVTSDGLIIKLKDGSNLTLKGQKIEGAEDSSSVATDFEFLNSNDSFTIVNSYTYTDANNESATANVNLPVNVKNIKAVTQDVEFDNYDPNVEINGLASSDTIRNHYGANSVVINSGSGADYIYNEANGVVINAGAGKDVIYLGHKYEFTNENEFVEYENEGVDSHSEGVTINAGGGNDTIYGNNNGDNDASKAHTYQYRKGDGKDVIYNFGANDKIDLKGLTPSNIEFINLKKNIDVTAEDKVLVATDDAGNPYYTYTFAAPNNTNETTDSTTSVNTAVKTDGTGNQWYVLKSATRPIAGTTDRYTESDLVDADARDNETYSEDDYVAVYKTDEEGVYTTSPRTAVDTEKETTIVAETTKYVYFKQTVVSTTASFAAYGVNDGVFGKAADEATSDETTTSLDEAATKIYSYFDADGNVHYVADATKDLTTENATDTNSNQLYLVLNATPTAAGGSDYAASQVSSDAADVATWVKTYWDQDTQCVTTESTATISATAYTTAGDNKQVYLTKGVTTVNADTPADTTTDLSAAATPVYQYTEDGATKLTTDSSITSTAYKDGDNAYYVQLGKSLTSGTDLDAVGIGELISTEAAKVATAVYTYKNASGTDQYTTSSEAFTVNTTNYTTTVGGEQKQVYVASNGSITNGTDVNSLTSGTTTELAAAATAVKYYRNVETGNIIYTTATSKTDLPLHDTGKYAKLSATADATTDEYTADQISDDPTKVAKFVYSYDNNGTEYYTNRSQAYIKNEEAHNGTGQPWYLKSMKFEADATDDEKAAAIAEAVKNKANWTLTATEAHGYSADNANAALKVKYYVDKDGEEHYTTEATASVEGQLVYEDGTIPVDDPDHKDVVITISGGTITLKYVEVGKYIHFINYGANDGTTENVLIERVHKLTSGEGTQAEHFKNTAEDYNIQGNNADNYVENSGENVYVELNQGGANFITNTGYNSTLQGSFKSDTITNDAGSVSIEAGNGNNVITNNADAEYTTINAGDGWDTVTNEANSVDINAGDGDNVITNSGEGVNIITGEGKDTIDNTGEDILIVSGAGNDSIKLGDSQLVSVQAGTGINQIISNDAGSKRFIYKTGSYGTDYIQGWHDSDAIYLELAADENYTSTVDNTGLKIEIYKFTTDADDNEVRGDTVGTIIIANQVTANANGTFTTTALGGGKEIKIYNYDSTNNTAEIDKTITTPFAKYADNDGNIEIEAGDDGNYTAYGTATANTIINLGASSTILADADKDTIYNAGEDASIDAGAGDDLIVFTSESTNYDPDNKVITNDKAANVVATITAGTGNDTIVTNDASNSRTGGIVYNYTEGDGNDFIQGYNENDTIQITGTYTTTLAAGTVDGKVNFIINVGTGTTAGTITLVNLTPEDAISIVSRNTEADEYEAAEDEIRVPYLVIPDADTHTATTSNSFTYVQGTSSNETINVEAQENITVDASGGADQINVNASAESVKIIAGAGNDTITNIDAGHSGIVYEFGSNDGNNVIYNFGAHDTIKYTGSTWDKDANGATLVANSAVQDLEDEDAVKKDLILAMGNTRISIIGGGSDGADPVTVVDTNGGAGQTIDATKVVAGTTGNDRLTNDRSPKLVLGYNGRDTITNTAGAVTINGGDGDDVINNSGSNVSITGGNGNDSINITGGNTNIIVASAGTDYVTVSSSAINEAGKGNTYEVSGASGTLYINGFTAYDTIKITDSLLTADSIVTLPAASAITSDGYFTFQIGSTNLYVKGTGVTPGKKVKTIMTRGSDNADGTPSYTAITDDNNPVVVSKVLTGTSRADTILSYSSDSAPTGAPTVPDLTETHAADYNSANYYVDAAAGDDFIVNNKTGATINAGNNNDTISNLSDGTGSSLVGGNGDDSIVNAANNVTIFAGAGADTITIENTATEGVVYYFANNNGSTTIKGAKALSGTLYFPGMRANQIPASEDIVINENGSQMTLTTSVGNTIVFEGAAGAFTNNSVINIKYGADETAITGGLKPGSRQLETTSYFLKTDVTPADANNIAADNVVAAGANASTTPIYAYTYAGTTRYTTNRNNITVTFDASYKNGSGADLLLPSDQVFNPADTSNLKTQAEIDEINTTNNKSEGDEGYVTGTPIKKDMDGNPTLATQQTGVTATLYTTGNYTVKDVDSGLTITASSAYTGTITNSAAKKVNINATSGAKNITNSVDGVTGTDTAVTISTGSSNDTITNSSAYSSISAGAGNDQITNSGANAYIDAGNGNDTISNASGGSNVTINGGAGEDSIVNAQATVTINAGNDNDYIKNTATGVSIFAGNGNDIIENNASDVTIFAGVGEDYIKNSATGAVTYHFANSNGTATINGYHTGDILYYERLNNNTKPTNDNATINSTYTQVSLTTNDGNTVVFEDTVNTFATDGVINDLGFKVQLGAVTPDANNSHLVTIKPANISLSDNADTYTSKNNNVTVLAGGGKDNITNTATGVYINASSNHVKTIDNRATAASSTVVTIATGAAADVITNSGAYASITAGNGANVITSSGTYSTIVGGRDVDTFNINTSSASNSLVGGAGDDVFNINAAAAAAANANTVYGGQGDDVFTNATGVSGTVFYYTGGSEGADSITGFGANDTIFVSNARAAISAAAVNETYNLADNPDTTDVNESEQTATRVIGTTFTIGSTTVYLAGKTSGSVKFNLNGTENTWDIAANGGAWHVNANVAENNFVMDDLFGDDSDAYTTDNSNSIDSIDYLGTSNYSAGNIENNDLNNLVPNNDATSATFGQDKDNQ